MQLEIFNAKFDRKIAYENCEALNTSRRSNFMNLERASKYWFLITMNKELTGTSLISFAVRKRYFVINI